tara:strand:- start:337 stop:720 length:384 start_codon:yes stop_codon:yes gene_type:complete
MNKKLQSYNSSQAKQILGQEDPKLIIYELLNGLNKNLSSLINNIDKNNINVAKKEAVKAQNIAFALRRTLDRNNGGEIAENLDLIYAHVHLAMDKFIKNNKKDLLSSALFCSSEILDGWKGLVNKIA